MKYNFDFDLYGKTYKGDFTFDNNVDIVYNKINEYKKNINLDFHGQTKDSNAIFKYIQDNLYIDLGISLNLHEKTIETIKVIFR